jgi:VanZ family protein
VLVWCAVIFGLSAIPSLGTGLGTWDLLLRKLAHMTEYAVLAVLLARALSAGGRAHDRAAPFALGLAVLYAATDEIHQTFVRGRHGRPLDVAIDAVGALIGLIVWHRLVTRATRTDRTSRRDR